MESDIENSLKSWQEKSAKIKSELSSGEVTKIQNMREHLTENGKKADFEGNVYSVFLENNIHCVFKFCEEDQIEEPEIKPEIIAYRLCKETGIGNIPPIVWRKITLPDGRSVSGYLSLFIDSSVDISNFEDDELYKLLETMDKTETSNYKIFNFVFGNFDVGVHNLLISDNKPVMIDNETIMNPWCVKYGEVPFVSFYRFDWLPEKPILSSKFSFESARFANIEARKEIKEKFDYSPTKRNHNFAIYKNCYWVQFSDVDHAERIKKLIYSDFLPEKTQKSLQKLTREKLLEIFGSKSRLANQLVAGILERRDMILKEFNGKKVAVSGNRMNLSKSSCSPTVGNS
jgi:hypothetical protein